MSRALRLALLALALVGCAPAQKRAADADPAAAPRLILSGPLDSPATAVDSETITGLADLVRMLAPEGGGEAPEGCHLQVVRVKGGHFEQVVYGCGGECPEGKGCKLVEVTDAGTRTRLIYCACGGEGVTPPPPAECHLELVVAGGRAEPRCAGECPEGKKCTLGTASLRLADVEITSYFCRCE